MRIEVDKVINVSEILFKAFGLNAKDAEIATNCLIEAELAGISTHGISMLPAHVKKLINGYNAKAELKIEKDTVSFSVCNAHNGIGMVSAWKCTELAIERSTKSGVHIVFCHNANTFSAAYCYAKLLVDNRKIGFVCCNSPAQMAPFNGVEKLLGTNPLAVGIPANNEEPFILDMATSAVAKSRINRALHVGEKIPFGWATDINGNPTDDPQVAVSGLILPMAGPKGYGLSMAIDIVSGLLSGAAYLDGVGRFYSKNDSCMNVGQMFVAIDPAVVYGENFFDKMDDYLHRIRSSQSSNQMPVFAPGDLNSSYKKEALQLGLEVSETLREEINILLGKIRSDVRL